MLRTLQRAGLVLAAVVVGMVAAAPAWAHVTVSSASAVQGGFAKLTFRVPNEKDNASTTRLEVHFPQNTPLANVAVKPVAGWTAKITRAKLATPVKTHDGEITEAVTTIVWTASADAAIKPGEFQEFDVSGGPLPEADQLVFKALQGYSDGDIVRWIEEPVAGQAEPEHPAPVLKLAKATNGDGNGGVQVSATPGQPAASPSDGKGTAALVIGVIALLMAGAALGLAVLDRRRSAASS
jgi:periplasmic copper chaperone A